MRIKTKKVTSRRRPQQRRAQLTVEAILDAVIRILKREGFGGVNTNRIAEVAGVSIGSVYQYFPDKRAILAGLHRRHVEEIDRLVDRTLVAHAASSLAELVRAMIVALVEAHTRDPELYELMTTEVPHRTEGTTDFASRLQAVFRLAIAARMGEHDVDKKAFVVAHMVDALSHGVALRRPKGLSVRDGTEEAVRAVMGYLN